jgi:tight adherence protein B
MSSYVVGSLPFVSALFMFAFNRQYIMRLFNDDAGHYFLGYGLISWSLGFMMMKKMMKIKL